MLLLERGSVRSFLFASVSFCHPENKKANSRRERDSTKTIVDRRGSFSFHVAYGERMKEREEK